MTCKLTYMSASMFASKYSLQVSFQCFYSSMAPAYTRTSCTAGLGRVPDTVMITWVAAFPLCCIGLLLSFSTCRSTGQDEPKPITISFIE